MLNGEIIKKTSLIVNTSPLGMHPDVNTSPNIPYNFLNENHFCFDLVYNPEQTEFLRKSKDQGAVIKNGLEMLILQAEESWKIWNNTK
jgi:shikimate dehydrogenase